MVQEQESKQRLINAHNERLKKYEADLKQECERMTEMHNLEDQNYNSKLNRLRDEKASEQHKNTVLIKEKQKAIEENEVIGKEIENLKKENSNLKTDITRQQFDKKEIKDKIYSEV